MDVTHVPSFGRSQYLHVSIDTCSGIMFATPLTGEKASHVIQHCLEAWSAWGKPKILKADNGPAYVSNKFQQFCHQMNVSHLTGFPYNPQGQDIVECAHRTIKAYSIKQRR
jgi:transposase InsO family protein